MDEQTNYLISVVIPVYNGEKTILRAIDSILKQSYPHLEVIVVDDGSTDNTKSVLNTIKTSRVKVINLDKNIGRSAARNLALHQARGEYIAMLDADDYAYPNRLERQLTYMLQHEVALCGTWAYFVDLSGRKTEWQQPTTTDEIRASILRSNAFIHSSVMARKSIMQEFGGYDENLHSAEDYDLYLKICRKYPVGNIPMILCEYVSPSGIKYRFSEQYYLSKVKWKAILHYGFPKRNIIYLFTPLISIMVPRRMKVWLKKYFVHNG